jgi:hypothetical protein
MATHLENLLQQVQAAHGRLRKLVQVDYTTQEIKDVIKNLGSNLEVS